MWKTFIKENLLKPAFRRAGTGLASLLMFGGDWMCANLQACGLVTESGADTVARYVIACALLAFDLGASFIERQKVAAKAAK